MLSATARLLWRLLAIIGLALAVIGTLLPVMPTVPFLLVALFAASRGWPELERWLLAHPVFGKHLVDWRERGAVSRRAKWFATAGIAAGIVSSVVLVGPARWIVALPVSVMLLVLAWLWRRPEPPLS